MKSSPPVPDILLSVLSIERFSVVTGPIGIMAICHFVPHDGSLKYIDAAKRRIDQAGCAVRPLWPFGRMWQKPGSRWSYGK
jgi:hypothetical protein